MGVLGALGLNDHALLQAGRKPRLRYRRPGSTLSRLAERQLDAVLFQLPPRLTRLDAPAGSCASPCWAEAQVVELLVMSEPDAQG